jgi:hypothetical protein
MDEHHAVVLTLAGGPDSVVTFPGGVPIRIAEQVVGGWVSRSIRPVISFHCGHLFR